VAQAAARREAIKRVLVVEAREVERRLAGSLVQRIAGLETIYEIPLSKSGRPSR
jgi:hypothetical protein